MRIFSLKPCFQAGFGKNKINDKSSRLPKKINTNYEEYRVNNSRNKDPFPQFIFDNKPVCFKIRRDGSDDFFQQLFIG